MAHILDLPSEILVLIPEEVVGRNLRRSVSNLTMCRKWFEAARAVYVPGINVSKVRIHGCDFGSIASKWNSSHQRTLLYKNTRKLRVRLLGHWWDQKSKSTLDRSDSSDDYEDEMNEPPAEFSTPEGRRAVMQWQRNVLDPSMKELFQDLNRYGVLERVLLETVLDASDEIGPQLVYLNSSTVARFLRNLPVTKDLRHLTLDLCSGLKLRRGRNPTALRECTPAA